MHLGNISFAQHQKALGPIARYFTLGQKCHEDKHLNPLFQALGAKTGLLSHTIYTTCHVFSTLNLVLSFVNLSPGKGLGALPVSLDLGLVLWLVSFLYSQYSEGGTALEQPSSISLKVLLRFKEREHMFGSLICNKLST